jgi:hypothetical protein
MILLTGININRYTAVRQIPAVVGGICIKNCLGANRESINATTPSIAFCGAYRADAIMQSPLKTS